MYTVAIIIRLCSGGIRYESFKHFTHFVGMCSLGERDGMIKLQLMITPKKSIKRVTLETTFCLTSKF